MFSLQNFFDKNQPRNGKFFAIAIDGRGGSGKGMLASYLRAKYPDINFLAGDDYFEPINNSVAWGAFNNARFIAEVITPLRTENTFHHKPYNFIRNQVEDKGIVTINNAFCLERCYSFSFNLDWDLKLWVETPAEICFKRGLARERLPHHRAAAAWKKWQYQEDKYIKANKPAEHADIVLDGTKSFSQQIQ